MVIKLIKASAVVLLCCYLNTAKATDKILVERYEEWSHPVLSVFKKYGMTLYKISYSIDGKYPTFYAKFKYSPDPRAPDAGTFHKVYFDTLKANSFFPYSLIDKEDNIRINVGWKNKEKNIMSVDIENLLSASEKKDGPKFDTHNK